jgi:hypothetical protein
MRTKKWNKQRDNFSEKLETSIIKKITHLTLNSCGSWEVIIKEMKLECNRNCAECDILLWL